MNAAKMDNFTIDGLRNQNAVLKEELSRCVAVLDEEHQEHLYTANRARIVLAEINALPSAEGI
jgi:hypothetical protein